MAYDVRRAYSLQRVVADVRDGALDELARLRDLRRGISAHDGLHPDQQVRTGGAVRGGAAPGRRHEAPERVCGEEALLLEVRLHGREPRAAVLADQGVVVYAHHQRVLRNAQPVRAAPFQHVVSAVVVCGADPYRTLEAAEAFRGVQLVAPQVAVRQGLPEGAEPLDAPLHDGRVVDERIRAAAPRGEKVVCRGAADFVRRVAHKDDVALARGERGDVDVEDDRGDVAFCERRVDVREAAGGPAGWNRDYESVAAARDCGADAVGGALLGRAKERYVPVVVASQAAEDAGEFLLPGNSCHP